MLRPWRAIVIDDHVVRTASFLDGIAATHRPSAAHKRGVRQQKADGRKVTVVDEHEVPTENWVLQARPYVIDFTGDGSGYLGGFDGHPFTKAHPAYGRLRWAEYDAR